MSGSYEQPPGMVPLFPEPAKPAISAIEAVFQGKYMRF
jgi:hypothetical protein